MALILKRVGRYELLKEVGRGGMATVYLARQTDLDRHVALKELASLHSADEAFAERFLRESRMAGSLSHPNIVTVHDYFEHEGTPYISMEYIERGSLRPLVGHLTLAQIAGVLEGLLAGLQHAASRGIVHRDMKPENVMVTAEGGVKISDFGIGRALNQAGNASKFLTATGTAIGTPAYMAPEQAMAKEVGPWTDLYSLGIMAYEMVLGEVPFSDSETPMSMLVRHVSETIPAPSTINPSIDPQLGEWLEWLLKKDPKDRPPSAGEAWDKLEEIVIHLLGPRWRREARLGDGEGEPHADEDAKPLTPAPFSEERSKVSLETPQPEYITVDPAASEAAAAVAAAGVAAAASAAPRAEAPQVAPEPAAAGPVEPVAEEPSAPSPAGEAEAVAPEAEEPASPEAAEPVAEEPPPAAEEPETPAGSLDLGEEEEDMYLTFAPGAKKAVAPPSACAGPGPRGAGSPGPSTGARTRPGAGSTGEFGPAAGSSGAGRGAGSRRRPCSTGTRRRRATGRASVALRRAGAGRGGGRAGARTGARPRGRRRRDRGSGRCRRCSRRYSEAQARARTAEEAEHPEASGAAADPEPAAGGPAVRTGCRRRDRPGECGGCRGTAGCASPLGGPGVRPGDAGARRARRRGAGGRRRHPGRRHSEAARLAHAGTDRAGSRRRGDAGGALPPKSTSRRGEPRRSQEPRRAQQRPGPQRPPPVRLRPRSAAVPACSFAARASRRRHRRPSRRPPGSPRSSTRPRCRSLRISASPCRRTRRRRRSSIRASSSRTPSRRSTRRRRRRRRSSRSGSLSPSASWRSWSSE